MKKSLLALALIAAVSSTFAAHSNAPITVVATMAPAAIEPPTEPDPTIDPDAVDCPGPHNPKSCKNDEY